MEITAMNVANYQIKDPLHFVFRLDAGSPFGNGHLMRSMVLCIELLERGHKVLLLVCQVPSSLLNMLRENKIDVQIIALRSDGLQEIARIHQENPIDWLVIDHYGIDAEWESAARRFAAHTMVIDDLANRRHACDLLLDQNVPNRLQEQYENLVPKNCVKAIGWSYLLARSDFYIRNCCDRSGTLVFLGGGNHSLALAGLIEKLLSQTEFHPLKILVSSDYLPCTHWQNLVGDCGQVHCDLSNPAPLYRSAKLALVRCGFVSYELALIGIPTVHIYSSVVQKEVAGSLETLNLGLALSEEHLFRSEKLNEAINQVSIMTPVPVNEKLSSGATKVAKLLESFHGYS